MEEIKLKVITNMKKIIYLTIISISIFACSNAEFTRYRNDAKLAEIHELYQKGKNEEDDKALIEAGKEYSAIINQKIYAQDRQAAVYRTLGERSLAKSQFGYATKYFSEALKILPSSPYLRYGLGISYMNLSESADTTEKKKEFIEKAENNIRFSTEKSERNPNYHAALASILGIHQDRYEEALASIETALRLRPDNVDYLFVAARIYYSLGDNEKAIAAYSKIVDISDAGAIKKQAEANMRRLIGNK